MNSNKRSRAATLPYSTSSSDEHMRHYRESNRFASKVDNFSQLPPDEVKLSGCTLLLLQ